MPLHVLGMSHQTAPIALREKMAVAPYDLPAVLTALSRLQDVQEATILSTCNRTEFYVKCSTQGEQRLNDWVQQTFGIDDRALQQHSYHHQDEAAVAHLIQVASGLDSLVLGEPQILGQVKTAYQNAQSASAAGPILDRLFQKVFAASKQIRTSTGIGSNPVSVASVAVMLARQIFGDLKQQTVLLVGAGEMIELCMRHLLDKGIKHLLIANRSIENARQLAAGSTAEVMDLKSLPRQLHRADIVITSTGASTAIISAKQLKKASRERRQRPIFVVDIAVPRDVDPAAAQLKDIYLYSIDDLQTVIEQHRDQRSQAAEQAMQVVDDYSHDFMRWWRAKRASENLRRMRKLAHADSSSLVAQALKQLKQGEEALPVLENLSRRLTNKLLHVPSIRLREAAEKDRYDIVEAADHLFEFGALRPDEEE